MPNSRKPGTVQVTFWTKKAFVDKWKEVAEEEDRSLSDWIRHVCKQEVKRSRRRKEGVSEEVVE